MVLDTLVVEPGVIFGGGLVPAVFAVYISTSVVGHTAVDIMNGSTGKAGLDVVIYQVTVLVSVAAGFTTFEDGPHATTRLNEFVFLKTPPVVVILT